VNASTAGETGRSCAGLLGEKGIEKAVAFLQPALDRKTSFTLLDIMGKEIGRSGLPLDDLLSFTDKLAETKAMGAYVIIASALSCLLENNLPAAMDKTREYIIQGDTWYTADNMAERVPGQALVKEFNSAVPFLHQYLKDKNPWVKRSAGVAVHFFAKRIRNEPSKMRRLLDLLAPVYEEKDVRIIKGIGWGLKTAGRYYPYELAAFLKSQRGKKTSALMLRKAVTYLNPERKPLTG
jgi:3-methyladenine DNA glycosylase AlkD